LSDNLVKIYLYVLIFSSLLFALVFGVKWLTQRHGQKESLITAKLLWRKLFFLISGLVGGYCFATHLLSNWLVIIVTWVLLLLGLFGAELLVRWRVKRVDSTHAA
jgi:small-conductance mechanosensitive channel